MTSDIYAIRGDLSGVNSPVSLRLYRHRDTTHLMYMTPDGKSYTKPEAEVDKAFNGPIDPPTSGNEGRFFWIRQKMPPEKTFPQGFEYVLMGVVTTPGRCETGIGGRKDRIWGRRRANQPLNGEWKNVMRPAIAEAPGAAATASFSPAADGKIEAFVTVVTTMDGPDIVALAKKRLTEENTLASTACCGKHQWWRDFYDRRENGRVFYGSTGQRPTDDIRDLYRSWTCGHGGGTKTDMRRFEGSAVVCLAGAGFSGVGQRSLLQRDLPHFAVCSQLGRQRRHV